VGRAMDAIARGDASACRHLAYYAERRAVVALLATEGIGVFFDQHFGLDGQGQCKSRTNIRTHQIAWSALEYWAGSPRSGELLASVVRPAGTPLGTWLDSFPRKASVTAIGKEWLLAWGLDLQRFGEDRVARNEASYRPTRLLSP